MKPIVSDYPLSGSQEQHLSDLFFKPHDPEPRRISAVRVTYDGKPEFGWLSVFRQASLWCDYLMFGVSTTDDGGVLLFDCCQKGIDKLAKNDVDADGFCKWDGCREIMSSAHCCGDVDMEEFLRALAVTVAMASRMAGYEGDGE